MDYEKAYDLELWSYAGAEAQAAAIADDIAYDAHDLDDAVRADLIGIEETATLPTVGAIYEKVKARYPEAVGTRLTYEITRRLIAGMINDVVAESGARAAAGRFASADDVRRSGRPLIAFSVAMAATDRALKGFLTPRMYQHERVLAAMRPAQHVLRDLFSHYFEHIEALPPEWSSGLDSQDASGKARRVVDFIAGMTDNFALAEHRRFFDSTPDLR